MWPTWGPPGSCRPKMGPLLALWTLLSGSCSDSDGAVYFLGIHLVGAWNHHEVLSLYLILKGQGCKCNISCCSLLLHAIHILNFYTKYSLCVHFVWINMFLGGGIILQKLFMIKSGMKYISYIPNPISATVEVSEWISYSSRILLEM